MKRSSYKKRNPKPTFFSVIWKREREKKILLPKSNLFKVSTMFSNCFVSIETKAAQSNSPRSLTPTEGSNLNWWCCLNRPYKRNFKKIINNDGEEISKNIILINYRSSNKVIKKLNQTIWIYKGKISTTKFGKRESQWRIARALGIEHKRVEIIDENPIILSVEANIFVEELRKHLKGNSAVIWGRWGNGNSHWE